MKTKRRKMTMSDIFGHPGVAKSSPIKLSKVRRKLSKVRPQDLRGVMWGYPGMGKSEPTAPPKAVLIRDCDA
jgi:hypothetical protein